MNENEFWLRLFGIIATGLVLIVLTISTCVTYTVKNYVDNGYEQVMDIGRDRFLWQKPNCK